MPDKLVFSDEELKEAKEKFKKSDRIHALIRRLEVAEQRCEKLRDALKHLAGNCECCPDMVSMGTLAQKALAVYEASL